MARQGIVLSIVLWLCAGGAFVAITNSRLPRGDRKLYSFIVLGVAIASQIGIAAYYDHQRRKALIAAFTERGFVPNTADGSPAQALHFVAPKGSHSFKASLSALGTVGDRPAHFAEYQYTIGRGKGAQTFRLAEFGLDVNPAAPPLRLTRRRGIFRKAPNLSTAHEVINKEWLLVDGDVGMAERVLSQPAFAEVLAGPTSHDEQWCVCDGWATVTLRRTVKAEDLDAGFGRVLAFAKAYAPEA